MTLHKYKHVLFTAIIEIEADNEKLSFEILSYMVKLPNRFNVIKHE